jgi:hypothetical protein
MKSGQALDLHGQKCVLLTDEPRIALTLMGLRLAGRCIKLALSSLFVMPPRFFPTSFPGPPS